jgi:hypothetical protein
LLAVLWALSLAAIALAGVALLRARRIAKRMEHLVESYWELRYEYGQLRAQVDRLQGSAAPDALERAAGPPPAGSTVFVPLSSVKRT